MISAEQRKLVYLEAYKDFESGHPAYNGICHYLINFYPYTLLNKQLGGWGYRSCEWFPEIQLFAFNENDFPATGYWDPVIMNDDIRKNILLLCAEMIEL